MKNSSLIAKLQSESFEKTIAVISPFGTYEPVTEVGRFGNGLLIDSIGRAASLAGLKATLSRLERVGYDKIDELTSLDQHDIADRVSTARGFILQAIEQLDKAIELDVAVV